MSASPVSPKSTSTINFASSPPFSPPSHTSSKSPEGNSSPASPTGAHHGPKYKVASHSVRITKNGYAIEPVELRYQEILNSMSVSTRRASDASFDSSQVGHKVLGLIRGFWSQPAFPRGRLINRQDKHASVETILAEFSQNPPYPHRETYGSAAKQKKPRSKSRSKSSGSRRPTSPSRQTSDQKASPRRRSRPDKPTRGRASPPPQADESLAKSIKDKFAPSSSPPPPPPSFGSQQTTSNQTSGSSSNSNSNHDLTSASPISSRATNKPSLLLQMFTPKQPQSQQPPANSYHSWIPGDKDQIFELLTNFCHQMGQVFSNEARIVNITSPCTVLGDIHGNLSDLRNYERSLWPKAPVCVSCNYLFLGDYVDRGEFSVECVLYLFAMKLISPKRFFLLRGNHEVAAIQRQYTFSRECELKFGQNGRQLWKSFNKVFDLMPLAAIIDNQIFCAHGGIPRSITEVQRLIKEIPSPLDNPETQCPAAWEILWNDPITDSELIGMIEMDNAVVTQTQITQTQALPDGQEQVTTTSSITLSSDEPAPKDGTTQAAATTTTTKTPTTSNNKQQVDIEQQQRQRDNLERGLSEADSILAREPAGALSFYIRPDDQSPERDSKPLAAAAQEAASSTSPPDEATGRRDENTLRTVPSDTSSIASTSPQQIMNDGFVANIKRGTAFLFSDQAINNFLKVNNLSHVIRAHEVIPTGFAFHGDGRVITIFSSSKYCGLNNQAACALVDRERIRILRLDTGDAGE